MSLNEIRVLFTQIQEHIGDMQEMLASQIHGEAKPTGDMSWVQHCSKKIEQLNSNRQALNKIEAQLIDVLRNSLSFDSDRSKASPAGLRTLLIEVSQGMINQNLLTLTDAKKEGKVQIGEKFEIQLPDGETFQTELCEPGNKLRERGYIRQFYEKNKIGDRDRVKLEEIRPGSWRLLPAGPSDGMEPFDFGPLLAAAKAAREPKHEKLPGDGVAATSSHDVKKTKREGEGDNPAVPETIEIAVELTADEQPKKAPEDKN